MFSLSQTTQNSLNRIETIPGLPDHVIVSRRTGTIPTKSTQKPKKIPLYQRSKKVTLKKI
jgi:hypothetical protein